MRSVGVAWNGSFPEEWKRAWPDVAVTEPEYLLACADGDDGLPVLVPDAAMRDEISRAKSQLVDAVNARASVNRQITGIEALVSTNLRRCGLLSRSYYHVGRLFVFRPTIKGASCPTRTSVS
jgi:hypothetical protein